MKCWNCQTELTKENWYPSSEKNKNNICKTCLKLKHRKYREKIEPSERKRIAHERYLKQKAKYPIWKKRANEKVKFEVMVHYGGNPPRCACPGCGEKHIEFLTIDHIENNGAQERKILKSKGKGIHFYFYLRKNNYPEGYRVLCMNCNLSLGAFGYCPHQKH